MRSWAATEATATTSTRVSATIFISVGKSAQCCVRPCVFIFGRVRAGVTSPKSQFDTHRACCYSLHGANTYKGNHTGRSKRTRVGKKKEKKEKKTVHRRPQTIAQRPPATQPKTSPPHPQQVKQNGPHRRLSALRDVFFGMGKIANSQKMKKKGIFMVDAKSGSQTSSTKQNRSILQCAP